MTKKRTFCKQSLKIIIAIDEKKLSFFCISHKVAVPLQPLFLKTNY